MILSKNAVGNLINRYKAVLGKCRLINTFGSLALAAALALGSAGLAVAATEWGPDKDVVITSEESVSGLQQASSLTVDNLGILKNGDASTGHIYVNGATTLKNGGNITLNGPYGIMGAEDATAEASDTFTGSLEMTGGALNINGSQLQVQTAVISGGTVNIAGKINETTDWKDGAMLNAGESNGSFTISGGTVNVGDYGQLLGSKMTISGGTVNLNGSGDDTAPANAILRAYGTDPLTLQGGSINVAEGKRGVLAANTTNIESGSLDINGHLVVSGNLDRSKANINDAWTAGTINLTGGSINIGENGHMILSNTASDGMKINVTTGQLDSKGKISISERSSLNYKEGTHSLGGNVRIGGNLNVTDAHLNLTEATLEEFSGTAGTIAVLRDANTTDNDMARVDMTDAKLADWLELGGAVTVEGNSTLKARLHLGTEAEIAADSITGGTSSVPGKVALLGNGSIQAQNMTLTGNALDIGDAETTHNRIKVNSLTLDPGTADTDFTLTSGKLYLKGEAGSTLNLGGTGALVITDNQGKLELGEDANPGGNINANVTSEGTVKVTQGKWTLAAGKTLDIAGGNLTVNGTLDVTPGTLKTATGATAEINGGGKVLANDTALDIDRSAWTSNNIKEAITVEGGGILKVDGLGALSLAQIKDLKTNLMTGAGLFDAGDATITDIATGDTVAYDDVHALGNTTINALRNATVTDVTGDLSGAYAKVLLKDTFSGDLVADNTTLQLTGSKGGALVSNGSGAADVSVDGTGTLMLGDAGSNNSGSLGNVNFGADGSLLAVGNGNGDFSVGDITAGSSNSGKVNVSGATLTAGDIGSTSAAINSVSANNGTLKATGGIYAGTVTATNGSISAKGNIALTGAASVTGGSLSADNITATSVSAIDAAVTAKKLTAPTAVTVANGTLTTTGTGTDASSVGALTLTDSKANLGDMTVASATTVTGGNLAANSLTLSADSTFSNGAQVNVSSLVAHGNTIAVGSDTDTKGGTTLTVGSLNLDGGSLFIDPNWGQASSNVAVGSFADSATGTDYSINGNVGVGMNSMAAIGTTDTGWLSGQVADVTNGTGLTLNGVDSALGIYSAQVLGDGFGITVDGTQTTTSGFTTNPNQLDFSGQSLLVVNAAAASDPAGAISSANTTTSATATIADGAKLRITDAKVGQKYTVLGDNIAANKGGGGITVANGWTGSNFSTDSRMIKGSFDAASGVLTASLNSSANIYPKLDGELVTVLDNAYTADEVGPAHVNSDVKGVRFLSRATNDNFIGANSDLAAKTIESAARIAVAGAVPQMAMAANNAAGAAITQRTSIAQPDGNGMQSVSLNKADGVNKKGAALWIMPLYQGQNAWGMEAGNFDLKWHGGLGGVALGGDYTFDNALRAGIAFNIGGGYAEGEGDLAKTTNSFNFWGLGAYAGWAVENFGVTADVNYTSTYNKVKQELPGAMQMRDLKSDITAYALSSGLRAEYKFNTQYVDIIPHLGVRYMYVNTDSYDVKSKGTVMHGDETSQNIWTFPIGVTFSKQVETGNGWYVKPSLDLGVLPATGDIDAKSKIRFTGTGTKAELDTRTMDYMSYTGGLGLDFGNNNLSFGLNYNIQASEHTTSHGVFGTARYEF